MLTLLSVRSPDAVTFLGGGGGGPPSFGDSILIISGRSDRRFPSSAAVVVRRPLLHAAGVDCFRRKVDQVAAADAAVAVS